MNIICTERGHVVIKHRKFEGLLLVENGATCLTCKFEAIACQAGYWMKLLSHATPEFFNLINGGKSYHTPTSATLK
jgi:hypothetical protein